MWCESICGYLGGIKINILIILLAKFFFFFFLIHHLMAKTILTKYQNVRD